MAALSTPELTAINALNIEREARANALDRAREAFLADPASLTIYTAKSGARSPRGRVHGNLDARLRDAITVYESHLLLSRR